MHPNEPARLHLAQLPTPVVELKNLSRQLGLPRLLVKRDDLTGLELTGNKIRKLEYLLADAVNQGCTSVVTYGGFQSNHCRATAAACARLGLHCRLLLRAPSAGDPGNDGNLFLDRLFGAEITIHSVDEYTASKKQLVEDAMDRERERNRKPYYFPVGGSVPLGCWGYVRCLHELSQQLGRDTDIDVYVTVSSSGTFAGLVLGQALLGLSRYRVVGIPVSDSVAYFRSDVRALLSNTIRQFSLDITEDQSPLNLVDGYIGEGYAIPFPGATDMIRTLARAEALLLDPTYTSKAFVGFVDQVRGHKVRNGATPVFIHTGGTFGLLARRDLFSA